VPRIPVCKTEEVPLGKMRRVEPVRAYHTVVEDGLVRIEV
jgi:hypothetical protein